MAEGVCGRGGHAWQACVKTLPFRGHAWQGSVCGGGHAWQRACVAGEGMHGRHV